VGGWGLNSYTKFMKGVLSSYDVKRNTEKKDASCKPAKRKA